MEVTRSRTLVAALLFGYLTLVGASVRESDPEPAFQDVFVAGEDGYHTYRIPALVVTKSGTLLAFSEGRRGGRGDAGDIDLLVKRSTDRGRTWSEQQTIWDEAGNTCGNPAPVVDRETGTVWLLLTWNRGDDRESEIIDGTSTDTRRIFVTSSSDDGRTWEEPRDVTSDVKPPDWTWYATGPGAGIQLEHGEHAGRLMVACDHIEKNSGRYFSHVVYSDDHGVSWKLGGSSPRDQVNESQVVESADGLLLLNMRNYDRSKKLRQVAFSADGGISWTGQRFDEALVEPICQASIRRAGDVILFSNPADPDQRMNMTVKVSRDEGTTWEVLHQLHAGPSAYSDLADLGDGTAACLFEKGSEHPYETITLARFPVPGLGIKAAGRDSPLKKPGYEPGPAADCPGSAHGRSSLDSRSPRSIEADCGITNTIFLERRRVPEAPESDGDSGPASSHWTKGIPQEYGKCITDWRDRRDAAGECSCST